MNNEIQFILYHLPDEEGKVQVVIKDETIWATQKAMAQLFGVGVPAISKHLTHIFDEGELDKEVVVSKMEITTQHGAIEGKTQKNETTFYSLDAIIADQRSVISKKHSCNSCNLCSKEKTATEVLSWENAKALAPDIKKHDG